MKNILKKYDVFFVQTELNSPAQIRRFDPLEKE